MTTEPVTIPNDPTTLTFVVGILVETLTKTLVALASDHDNQPGDWLDELEADAIRTIKNSLSEGAVSLQAEHRGVSSGLAIVMERFHALRLALGQRPDGNDRA